MLSDRFSVILSAEWCVRIVEESLPAINHTPDSEQSAPQPDQPPRDSGQSTSLPEEHTPDSEPNIPETGNRKPVKKKKKRTAASYVRSFLIKIGVTAIALWILLSFIIGIFVCHDNNAYPMIKDGDLCITLRLGSVSQGDEIVYRSDGSHRFGRVIARSGDMVEIEAGSVTVNGYAFVEDTVYPTTKDGAQITFPYQVPDDCVFVLNDYRENSNDSRICGGIPLSAVEGRVIFVLRRRGI